MKSKYFVAVAGLWLVIGSIAHAQNGSPSTQGHEGHHPTTPASATAQAEQWTEGEIKKIDLKTGKVTLKHGYIPNVDMPPMTMVFGISDKQMLNRFKVGDKVRFKVVDEKGQLVVTEMVVR